MINKKALKIIREKRDIAIIKRQNTIFQEETKNQRKFVLFR